MVESVMWDMKKTRWVPDFWRPSLLCTCTRLQTTASDGKAALEAPSPTPSWVSHLLRTIPPDSAVLVEL